MPTTVTGNQPLPSGMRQGLLGTLLGRFRHLWHEVGKFGVVGVVAFVVDFALFNLARVGFEWAPIPAKTLSTVAAATIAFVGNRFWTWRNRERSSLAREYLLYFIFNAVGLGIGLACLAINNSLLGSLWPRVFRTLVAENIAANVVGTVLGTLFRFWSYRRFVFIGAPTGPASMAGPERD